MRSLLKRAISSPWVLVVAVAAAAVVGTAFLFTGSGHEVVVRFTDANGLVSGNEVRVAGIEAGTVKSVDARVDPKTGQQYAEAVLDIQDAHWPLHQGTQLEVRPKGVLSNVFVALNPGSRSNPNLDPNHIFTLNETGSPTNLDALSDVFSADVRESMRTQIQEGVLAFGGSGADDLNGTLHNLNPLTYDLAPITQVLAVRSPEFDRLNTEFDTITHELSSEDANLRGLIVNGNATLGVLALKNHQLQNVLDHAAGLLTSIDLGLKGEEPNLQAIFAKGPAALDKTKRANDLLVPLLIPINPHIPSLEVLLHQFGTATGFAVPPGPTGGGVFASRIDAILNFPDRSAVTCGGEPVEQTGCPAANRPNLGPSSSSASGTSGSSSASSSGSPAAPVYQSSPTLFGGLFG